MLKLKMLHFEDGEVVAIDDCGNFRSYADIGKALHHRGKPGKYYVLPSNLSSLAAIREIEVKRDKYGKEVIMDGSVY